MTSCGDLAAELAELGYLELFLRMDEDALDRVWARDNASADLHRLVSDTAAATLPRFLAAQVLLARDPGFPAPTDRSRLAGLLADALAQDAAGMANPWGLPGELDGRLARQALALGPEAAPAFAALLDDDSEVEYGGSEEATVGNGYRYRVKDLAAELVASLLGAPYRIHLDPAARDTEIDMLRRRVP